MTFSLRQKLDLTGRVAIVTGAANILGPEFCAALAEFGATVALLDINEARCADVAEEVAEAYEARTVAIRCDVTDEEAVSAAVDQVVSMFGRVDLLLNAAADKSGYTNELPDYTLADWEHDISVNLTGSFLCAKHVTPHFISQGQGNIINIASIYGIAGPDPRIYEGSEYLGKQISTPPTYSASKGGVVALTRYLATTLVKHNVRANCITPGGVFSGQSESFVEKYSARVPMDRMGAREELRGAVLFLASDASSYVNGHNLVVDGGLSAW